MTAASMPQKIISEKEEKMAKIKIMPCLDMREGRVVKGVHFVDIADAGDPVACAQAYCAAGADELALLDITATVEKRATLADVVKRVAACEVSIDNIVWICASGAFVISLTIRLSACTSVSLLLLHECSGLF